MPGEPAAVCASDCECEYTFLTASSVGSIVTVLLNAKSISAQTLSGLRSTDQCAPNKSFGGIDDWHDACRPFWLRLAKRFVDGRTRSNGRSSEVFCGGGVTERALPKNAMTSGCSSVT